MIKTIERVTIRIKNNAASIGCLIILNLVLAHTGMYAQDAKLKEEISELNSIFNEAFVKKNTDELMGRYDKKLLLLPPNTPMVEGSDAMKNLYKYVISNDIKLTHTVEKIIFSDDYSQATVIGRYETKGQKFSDSGKYLFLLKRKNNSWIIAVDMFSSNLPLEEK